MAKKRASMREGPLADLFRSTGEPGEEEIEVTATAAKADVAVADEEVHEEIRVERVEVEVERHVEPEPPTGEHEVIDAAPEPPTGETMLDPHKDPAIEDVERRQTRALHVNEEVQVEHEGLQRLMGGVEEEVRPAFGRD